MTSQPSWNEWLSSHQSIESRIRSPKRTPLESDFLTVHAVTESYFRRVLFVGLRLNYFNYKNADEWLFHNDKTPERKDFVALFDKLYSPKNFAWGDLLRSNPTLSLLWDLWLDFSKVIRNHISHGIRSYSDEWLICGIKIDQMLIMNLDQCLYPFVGGSIAKGLGQLSPRLPRGKNNVNFVVLTGKKTKKPRPKVSLSNAESIVAGLINQHSAQLSKGVSN